MSDQAVQVVILGGVGHGLDVLVVLDAVLLAQLVDLLEVLDAVGGGTGEVAEVVGLDGGLLHVGLLLLGLGQLVGLQPQIQHIAAELGDRKSTRLNSSHAELSRMPSSA